MRWTPRLANLQDDGMGRRAGPLMLLGLLVVLQVVLSVLVNLVTAQPGHLLVQAQRLGWPLIGVVALLTVPLLVWTGSKSSAVRAKWSSKRSPYPGLTAFGEEDAPVFFGRKQRTWELARRMQPGSAHRFIPVIGPSGAGKSSLVHAGLLPYLVRQREPWLFVPPFVPTGAPMMQLVVALASKLDIDPADLTPQLDERGAAALAQICRRIRADAGKPKGQVLLVIDQLEELLTLAAPAEGAKFLRILDEALEQDERLWVVATLRSEFFSPFLELENADLFKEPFAVAPLNRPDLLRAIEGPAHLAALTFEPGLVQRMVDDTGGGDALPLLAFTLEALYERVGRRRTISFDDYEALGGVPGALTQRADEVMAELEAGTEPSSPRC